MPAGTVPVVVQGRRIGHAVVNEDGSMRVLIDGIRSEFEGRTGVESSRIFDLEAPDPKILTNLAIESFTLYSVDGSPVGHIALATGGENEDS